MKKETRFRPKKDDDKIENTRQLCKTKTLRFRPTKHVKLIEVIQFMYMDNNKRFRQKKDVCQKREHVASVRDAKSGSERYSKYSSENEAARSCGRLF